jgi:hypothetical protein
MENNEWWRRNEAMNVEVQVESTYNNNKRKPAEIQSGKFWYSEPKVQGRSRNWGKQRIGVR